MILSASQIEEFRRGVLRHYGEEGRSFPWRTTRDPWLILVSEVMLQQTRTETVLSKWPTWTERFPTPESLASAPLAEVLSLWKGLGYNRRALALKKIAGILVTEFSGRVPREECELRSLPGVGPYTARAVRAFAFGMPGVVLETNIRAVYLFYFFPGREKVADTELAPYIEATLVPEDPRTWYYALMDYGVALKRREPNPGRRSASYSRQSPYEGSHRQVRAAILHDLASRGPSSVEDLSASLERSLAGFDSRDAELEKALNELASEGFLVREGRTIRLSG